MRKQSNSSSGNSGRWSQSCVAVAVGFPSAGPRALAPLLGLQRARRLHADCVSVCAAVWQLPQSQPNTTRTAAAWHAGRQREEEWEEVEELEGGKVTLAVNRKALTFGYVLPSISSHNHIITVTGKLRTPTMRAEITNAPWAYLHFRFIMMTANRRQADLSGQREAEGGIIYLLTAVQLMYEIYIKSVMYVCMCIVYI